MHPRNKVTNPTLKIATLLAQRALTEWATRLVSDTDDDAVRATTFLGCLLIMTDEARDGAVILPARLITEEDVVHVDVTLFPARLINATDELHAIESDLFALLSSDTADAIVKLIDLFARLTSATAVAQATLTV